MREYSDKFHQISCWADHPDDYETIFSEFISFLKVNAMIRMLSVINTVFLI